MPLKNKLAGIAECLKFENSIQLLLSRLLFRSTRFVSYRMRGVELLIDHGGGDECGVRPCVLGDMYRIHLAAMRFPNGQPLNVLDIGANAGGFSLMLAVDRVPLRKLVEIEMNPLTYSRMRLNVLTHFGPRAVPLNAAISGESGSVDFPFTPGGTSESLLDLHAVAGDAFKVPLVTFDDCCASHFAGETIDLVRLDVEGAEWGVLSAGTCRALERCRYLIVEVHPREGRGIEDFSAAMRNFGLTRLDVTNPAEPDVFCFENREIADATADR